MDAFGLSCMTSMMSLNMQMQQQRDMMDYAYLQSINAVSSGRSAIDNALLPPSAADSYLYLSRPPRFSQPEPYYSVPLDFGRPSYSLGFDGIHGPEVSLVLEELKSHNFKLTCYARDFKKNKKRIVSMLVELFDHVYDDTQYIVAYLKDDCDQNMRSVLEDLGFRKLENDDAYLLQEDNND